MEMTEELQKIIDNALMPAQGCTDPVSVAFAAARARQELSKRIGQRVKDGAAGVAGADESEKLAAAGDIGRLEKIKITINANLYKNAARVTIPGTTDCGVTMAAALGYLAGDSDRNLEVLSDLAEADIEAAKELVEADLFEVEINRDINRLLIDLELTVSGDTAGEARGEKLRLVILDYYTSVEAVEYGDEIGSFKVLPINAESRRKQLVEKYELEDFIEFAENVEIDQLEILKEGISLSEKLAAEGIEYKDGMAATIKSMVELDSKECKLLQYPSLLASAASEARMTGSSNPAMSLAGSGNQGITAFLTLIGAAEALEKTEEELLRALALGVLISVYVKSKLGVLSAMCGAGVAAAFGASGGIVYLLGGSKKDIFQAGLNLYGVLTGIVCDGAKKGCAYKVAISSHWAVQAAVLASRGIGLSPAEGMLADNMEDLLDNLASLNSPGMDRTDAEILDIMLEKEEV
ncbi:MAG: serine dehydratase subunit alpha family protein [Bacillota bacterium]